MTKVTGQLKPAAAVTQQPELAQVLGANVKRLRVNQHITKKTFAIMVGIGRPFLDQIESGASNPRLDVVHRLADALSVDPLDLLENDVRSKR